MNVATHLRNHAYSQFGIFEWFYHITKEKDVNVNDRIIISRIDTDNEWRFVSNPRWDLFTKAQSAMLANDANEYAEYKNCGVVNRMIRRRDASKYGISQDAIGLSCSDRECYQLLERDN